METVPSPHQTPKDGMDTTIDLEKVVNHPQAKSSEIYNVLKIALFVTKDEQKYVYQMLVWHDGILNPKSNFEIKIEYQ